MSVAMKRKASTLHITNQRNNVGFSINNPRRLGSYRGRIQTCRDGVNIIEFENQVFNAIPLCKKEGYPCTILKKNINDYDYNVYLQKIKGNVIKQPIPSKGQPCNIVKNVEPFNYQTYLNSIKGNITKLTPVSEPNINCNCKPSAALVPYENTIYYVDRTILLNNSVFLESRPILATTNLVPFPNN
jgi:hypothetical protein